MNERDMVGLAEGDGRGTRRRGEGAIGGNLGVGELLIHEKGSQPMTLTVYLPTQLYEQRLRALAAWWCLGSSALRPDLLLAAGPVPPADLRAAGL